MSLHYSKDLMKYETEEDTSYICCYPSVSLKQDHDSEIIPKEIYSIYPYASYYNAYASCDTKRAKAGDCQVFPPTDKAPGIINMFIHIYPVFKTYPNDNHTLRIRWFIAALEKLGHTSGIKILKMTIPPGTPQEKRDYINALDDFTNSYKLNNKSNVDIFIHGEEPPEKQSIKINQKNPLFESKATLPLTPKYKLEFNEAQLCETLLYEIDFAKYTIITATETLGIMKYFPDGWELVKKDTLLLTKAKDIDSSLGDLIGTKDIYPPAKELFAAFNYCTMPKVIILGQDPYHGPGQAHGLAFSVNRGIPVPPSLRNVFKALENDNKIDPQFKAPGHGCLTEWAQQGVILLNCGLTVPRNKPAEHITQWEPFTDHIIKLLSQNYKNLVFVLWGAKAQKKKSLISSNHIILEYNHPSPQVNGNKFSTECKNFSEINDFLKKYNKTPINWQLTV